MKRHGKKPKSSWAGKVGSLDVGRKLRLVPIWERGISKSDRIEIIIDPGAAFGIGDHPTTIMALEFLERELDVMCSKGIRPSMIDVGTGTGVLAIAGMALGTGYTIGLDIDHSAVYSAGRNTQLNRRLFEGDSFAEFFVGGVESVRCTFDVAAANLAAPTLLRIRDDLLSCFGSMLVLSGIAETMADDVIRSYCSAGLGCIEREQREGWVSAVFVR